VALLIALPARAQVNIGVVGGVNIATLSGNDASGAGIDFSSRTAFGVGGVLDIGLSDNVALRLEPMYLQKGGDFNLSVVPLGNVNLKFAAKTTYVEVPVFLKVQFGTSTARPYLMGGPTLGLKLSSKFDASGPGIASVDLDADNVTESTDFGLGIGGGVSFSLGSNSIFIEGRYALGLSDIFKAGTVTIMGQSVQADNLEIKTRGVQFMAGITFPLGSE
jgi:opacity protein-like surface antigen